MNHEQNEKLYFLFSLKNPEYITKLKPGFFKTEQLIELFKLVQNYHKKFSEIPETGFTKTLCKVVSNTRYKGSVTQEEVKSIFNEDVDDYDDKWLHDSVKSWSKLREFESNLGNGIEYLKTQEITPENTEEIINKTKRIFTDTNVVYDESSGVNFFNPTSFDFTEEKKISTGKKFVDRFLGGGYKSKTLICYLGQQGVGKSLWLCNDAKYFAMQGKNVVYISAEMDELSIVTRIGSMMYNKPIAKFKDWAKTPDNVINAIDELEAMGQKLGTLGIVQLANPSVVDIENYLLKYQKDNNVKVDVVIVDYIGILSNYRNPNSENTYVNGKVISKDLRDSGIRNDWLTITAQQIGKGSWDSSDMTIGAISESAGIAHNADLIYGIIQDSEMDIENIYWLKILKIRDGDGRNVKCKFKKNTKTLSVKETNELMANE